MCECCGFCITVAVRQHTQRAIRVARRCANADRGALQVHDEHAHMRLQSRFENRCPVMLYSAVAGMGAGRVGRRFGSLPNPMIRGWGARTWRTRGLPRVRVPSVLTRSTVHAQRRVSVSATA